MLTASIFMSQVGPVHSLVSCGAWLFVVVVMVMVVLLVVVVTLVGCWPDLGPKCGARADFFLMQLTWYVKGMVLSDLEGENLGQGESHEEKEDERGTAITSQEDLL